jgi:hypothetical protein
MKRNTLAMQLGFAVVGLAGVVAAGCGDDHGLGKTEGGVVDTAASLGGQIGSTSSPGGQAGTEAAAGAMAGASGGAEVDAAVGISGTGGMAGTKGTIGAGGSAGAKSTGGVLVTGGTIGAGGAKGGSRAGADAAVDGLTSDGSGKPDGANDAGAKDAQAFETQSGRDSTLATDATLVCPALCDLFCANGNLRDENGCELCICNSAPPCPAMKCQACANGYVRDTNGCLTCTCAPDPSVPCNQLLDLRTCGSISHCRWLAPPCSISGGNKLVDAETGCYERVDCATDSDCKVSGTACAQRAVDPDPYGAGGDWCGMTVHVCL